MKFLLTVCDTIGSLPDDIDKTKKNITNEIDNILQVHSMSIIMSIFMSDIFLLYMSNEEYFSSPFKHVPSTTELENCVNYMHWFYILS